MKQNSNKNTQTFCYRRIFCDRAGLFAGLGLWGVVPGLHACLAYGSSPAMKRVFGHEIVMGAIYLVRRFTLLRRSCSHHSIYVLSGSVCIYIYLLNMINGSWVFPSQNWRGTPNLYFLVLFGVDVPSFQPLFLH